MLELGAGADILRAFVWLYWGGLLLAVVLVLRFVKNGYAKVIGLLVVLGLFLGPVLLREWEVRRERDAFLARQKVGQAHFQERCKTSGEKINRTVDNVDGILLMKIRSHVDVDSQFAPDDLYGFDNGGDDYIKSFLRVVAGKHLVSDINVERYRQGYRWVEATDPKDGRLYRFSLVGDVERLRSDETWAQAKKNIGPDVGREVYGLVLKRQPIDRPVARYGVTWADISTRDDRTQWVAGGVIQVIDLQTQEVIAERKGFMWDYGMGSRAGGRSPWLFAQRHACPAFPERGPGDPRRERSRREGIEFVTKVLEPTAKE